MAMQSVGTKPVHATGLADALRLSSLQLISGGGTEAVRLRKYLQWPATLWPAWIRPDTSPVVDKSLWH